MAFTTPGGFTSAQDFTLFDDAMQRLESRSFLTGIRPGTQEVRGIAEGALRVGAEKELGREDIARQFELQQQGLDIERSRSEALTASEFERTRLAEKGQRSQAIAGVGALAGLALFAPIFSSTTGKATTIAGKLFTRFFPSSIRYKENVSDMENVDSERIYDLNLVRFNYKEDSPVSQSEKENVQYGLMAEEVAKVIPEMVIFDEQGRPDMIDYSKLVPLLLKELQEMKKTFPQGGTNASMEV